MSISIVHIFTGIFSSIFAIYGSRFLRYNKAIMERVSIFYIAPQEGGKTVAISKAQQKAVHKYVKANYDRMELTVPKGQKEAIKAHAEAREESVNSFVNRAIQDRMERDRRGEDMDEMTTDELNQYLENIAKLVEATATDPASAAQIVRDSKVEA